MKKWIAVLIVMCLLIGSHVFAAQPSDEASIYIDASIMGEEKQIIYDVIKNLPASDRENVIFFAEDGTIYANKPELKESWTQYEKVEGNTYQDQEGNILIGPMDEGQSSELITIQSYTCTGTEGPYRRVHSKSGYAWYGGNVYLPSKAKNEVKDQNYSGGNRDTSYIYTGGRSSSGIEVDIGFLHNTNAGTNGNGNWGAFRRVAGGTMYSAPVRFAPGQTIYWKFYVPQYNQIALYFEAIPDGDTTKISYTIVGDATGWKKNGTGNIIKRITHIAQPQTNLTTGSYLKNVRWSNSKIGLSDSQSTNWLSNQTGGTCLFPNSSIVKVNFADYSQETVDIIIP
ncbi:hypothetical protein [Desulfitibacter alkalitolerans]|uniref:hypothetical protein n=1 Tax=Desulfitibacter alkalitolerans TaxID=264641 RepID=UPI000485A2D6|nr:hypothetical protein [Desulfitibacter alkalitolerans]